MPNCCESVALQELRAPRQRLQEGSNAFVPIALELWFSPKILGLLAVGRDKKHTMTQAKKDIAYLVTHTIQLCD
jgi:hypothetical protein